MALHLRLSLGFLLLTAAFGFPGHRAHAQKEPAGDRWPDATEINRMFGSNRETPVQKHIRAAFAAKRRATPAPPSSGHVLRLHPEAEYSGAYFYRAQAYEQIEQWVKAIADMNAFLKRNPKSAPGFAARGILHADREDFGPALRDLDRALTLNPRYAYGYALRADAYRLQDQYDKAFRDAARALELNPKLPRAYQVQGRIYEEKEGLSPRGRIFYHGNALRSELARSCDRPGERL